MSTIDALAIELRGIKEKREAIKSEDSALYKAQRDLEHQILDKLQEVGVSSATTSVGNVRISETVQPKVNDWSAVNDYIVENNIPYLFQRRLTATAYRELLQNGIEIPGTEPTTITNLGFTRN